MRKNELDPGADDGRPLDTKTVGGGASEATLTDDMLTVVEVPSPHGSGVSDPPESRLPRDLAPVSASAGSIDAIGPYRVEGLLGAGGMGHVFLAEQTEPVRRKVALKRLRLNLSFPNAEARFDAERRAMERLDHPNVAKILDAGTVDGSPYLVMELIDGEPLTDYCDRRRLGLEERLRILIDVCRGVEHAHRQLLLHRDVKPSNVLVTEVDGHPVPKLIDFGISKMLQEGAPQLTGNQLLGTPSYMSPEALSRGEELDTRADVFSLGVLTFQVLTGHLPWTGGEVSLATLLERRVREEPARPSSLFSGPVSEKARRAARRRSETLVDLRRRLRRDLDWIVLKAIALDADERYGSAAELAADLERTLDDRPVEARPPTAGYLLRKSLRRHRAALLTAALFTVALCAGITGTSIGFLQARDEAESARRARADAEQVVKLLIQSFGATGPRSQRDVGKASELTALELIERTASRVDEELEGQPAVRGRLEMAIGDFYHQIGRLEDARRHLSSAARALGHLEPIDPVSLARTHAHLAEVEMDLAVFAESRRHLETALGLIADVRTSETKSLEADLADIYGRLESRLGRFDLAANHLEKASRLHGELDGDDSRAVGASLGNLAKVRFTQKRWEEAEDLYRKSLEILKKHYPEGHQRRLNVTNNLAAAIASQGRNAEAAPFFETVASQLRDLLSDEHPMLANTLNNLGVLYDDLGEPERSAAFHREALQIRRGTFGEQHPLTAWSLDNLARAEESLGRPSDAEDLQRKALSIREGLFGPDHLDVGRSLSHLADLAMLRGDDTEALPLGERSFAIHRAGLEEGHGLIGQDAIRLGKILWRLGRTEEAGERFTQGLALLEAGGDRNAEELDEARRHIASYRAPSGGVL